MLTCPLCPGFQLPKLSELLTHIRIAHADQPGFMIQCNLEGCQRTFKKFSVFRNHVYALHNTGALDSSQSGEVQGEEAEDSLPHEQQDTGEENWQPDASASSQFKVSEEAIQRAAGTWILKTRESHRIPQSVMEEIISDVHSLYQVSPNFSPLSPFPFSLHSVYSN